MIGLPLFAAVLGALASWRLHVGIALPAYWLLAGLTVPLLAHDLREHRLPNRLTLPAYPLIAGPLIASSWLEQRPDALGRALLAATALALVFGALHVRNPTGIGAGDVKLSGALGLALGWLSWGAVLDGAIATAAIGAGTGLLVRRRRGRTAAFAFGPALLAGTWVTLLW